MRRVILASALSLVLSATPIFAGSSNSQSSQQASQTSQQASQCSQQSDDCQKPGVLKKMKESFKKGFEAGKKLGNKAHDSIQNKIMDGGVCVKEKLTGKKDKTFVKGHYTKDGKHVKGHWRKLEKKGKV